MPRRARTTSLPERAEAGRNYDYRYAWIRDQCYAGSAVAAAGGGDSRLKLPGYPGGFNLTGNRVNRQFQLDICGEALLLFANAARLDRCSSRET